MEVGRVLDEADLSVSVFALFGKLLCRDLLIPTAKIILKVMEKEHWTLSIGSNFPLDMCRSDVSFKISLLAAFRRCCLLALKYFIAFIL